VETHRPAVTYVPSSPLLCRITSVSARTAPAMAALCSQYGLCPMESVHVGTGGLRQDHRDMIRPNLKSLAFFLGIGGLIVDASHAAL
jgi:hypothetical protein